MRHIWVRDFRSDHLDEVADGIMEHLQAGKKIFWQSLYDQDVQAKGKNTAPQQPLLKEEAPQQPALKEATPQQPPPPSNSGHMAEDMFKMMIEQMEIGFAQVASRLDMFDNRFKKVEEEVKTIQMSTKGKGKVTEENDGFDDHFGFDDYSAPWRSEDVNVGGSSSAPHQPVHLFPEQPQQPPVVTPTPEKPQPSPTVSPAPEQPLPSPSVSTASEQPLPPTVSTAPELPMPSPTVTPAPELRQPTFNRTKMSAKKKCGVHQKRKLSPEKPSQVLTIWQPSPTVTPAPQQPEKPSATVTPSTQQSSGFTVHEFGVKRWNGRRYKECSKKKCQVARPARRISKRSKYQQSPYTEEKEKKKRKK